MAVDVQLLMRTLRSIEDDPSIWDQRRYDACFAHHVALQSNVTHERGDFVMVPNKGKQHVVDYAADVLGLPRDDRPRLTVHPLFHSATNTLPALRAAIQRVINHA